MHDELRYSSESVRAFWWVKDLHGWLASVTEERR